MLIQGTILNAYYGGRCVEIKRAETFYGYGWLDNNRIFVAYQPSEFAEAQANVEVIDLRDSKMTRIVTIGDIGEGNFDVNETTHEILFNDSDGIKLLLIKGDNSYKIELLKNDVGEWSVFWIDNDTIGYLEANGEFKTIERKDF